MTHNVHIYRQQAGIFVDTDSQCRTAAFARSELLALHSERKAISMLADLLVARCAFGADRGRDDLHRHATFYCGVRSFLRKLFRVSGA